MSNFYYCPICGTILYYQLDHCRYCKSGLHYHKSKRNTDYYIERARQLYKDPQKWQDVLYNEEIKRNPIFDLKMAEYVKTDGAKESAIRQFNDEFRQESKAENHDKNAPKCPTCSSTDIKRISGMKRALHGYAFGIFSKTAFSQFECQHCGYKW